jgi:hypothetical protein
MRQPHLAQTYNCQANHGYSLARCSVLSNIKYLLDEAQHHGRVGIKLVGWNRPAGKVNGLPQDYEITQPRTWAKKAFLDGKNILERGRI